MRELHEWHICDSLQELTIRAEGSARPFLKKEINLSEGHGLGVDGFGGKGFVSFVIVELIRVFVRVHCSQAVDFFQYYFCYPDPQSIVAFFLQTCNANKRRSVFSSCTAPTKLSML